MTDSRSLFFCSSEVRDDEGADGRVTGEGEEIQGG
jgi:hypothetical protein